MMELVIDFVFFVDIIITFRTGYLDDRGDLKVEPKVIAKNYLRMQFWIDLSATLPLDTIVSILLNDDNELYALLGLIKMGRIFRLKKIIQFLNLVEDLKAFLNLIKLIFFIIMYIHCFACVWWYIIKDSQDWIPPKDMIHDDWYHLYKASTVSKYTHSLYLSVQLMIGVD